MAPIREKIGCFLPAFGVPFTQPDIQSNPAFLKNQPKKILFFDREVFPQTFIGLSS